MTGDKFVPELYLRQPGFTYSTWGPFTKHRGRILRFRETSNLKHIYEKELDKACFAHDNAYYVNKKLSWELFQVRFWKKELMRLL